MSYQPQRIDVHHHVLPPEFMADLQRRGARWTGGPAIPDWNIAQAHGVMERHGIAQAVVSVVPHVDWGDRSAAAQWARHCNEYLARVVQDDPQRFGAFATLPMPYTTDAVRELEYALDVLKLDGVLLMSSNGDRYPGDPLFEELFQELQKRKAVVFIHPNTVPPGAIVPKLTIPWGVGEFVFDTTRAALNLIVSGTLDRTPSVRYILAHAGGTLPYLAMRLSISARELAGLGEHAARPVEQLLQRFHYDTALSTSNATLAALQQLGLPQGRLLFGSDWPMVPERVVKAEVAGLEGTPVLGEAEHRAIDRGNALALFPRFGAPGRSVRGAQAAG